MAKSRLASKLQIMQEISKERVRQSALGYTAARDEPLSAQNWAAIRGKYENRQLRQADPIEQRRDLIKIAAVTVAQIEAIDRLQHIEEIEEEISTNRRAELDAAVIAEGENA